MNFVDKNECIQIIDNNCPDMLYFPTVPVLFGDIYFAYQKTDSQNYTKIDLQNHFIYVIIILIMMIILSILQRYYLII